MDMTKLRPLQDRVVVKRDRQDDKTVGGIIIPDNAKEKLTRGTVVAVGPGKFTGGKVHATPVRVGQRVLFGKYSGTELSDDHQIMPIAEIYGVIED